MCYKGKCLSYAYFGIVIGCDCDFDLLHNVMGSSRAHATSFYQVSWKSDHYLITADKQTKKQTLFGLFLCYFGE